MNPCLVYGKKLIFIERDFSQPSERAAHTHLPALTASLNIRGSVKDSIVNYNAFQKVFRSRLDESRSHISLSNFKNLSLNQPFLNDMSVPYTSMLGKNRISFYQTPLYKQELSSELHLLGTLYNQNNTQAFEFPFMDALQSDLIRYT